MEIRKAFKLVQRWVLDDGNDYGDCQYGVLDFITWIYKEGFYIDTRFQGEDAEKQEELIK